MRTLLTLFAIIGSFALHAQNVIWSHAIGNWRNGPVVYITPLIETTEAFTTPQLIQRYKQEYPILEKVTDLDVLRFGTPEEGDQSRLTLKAKYGIRKLEVVLLELPEKEVEH